MVNTPREEVAFKDLDIAAVCLYLSSKQNDQKYLVAQMFVKGVKMTVMHDKFLRIGINEINILEMETFILKICGYSLSVHNVISPLNFYNIFYELIEPFVEHCDYELLAVKNFGVYLIHMMMMYPSSLYKFGPNLLAASALHLTLRVCQFSFNWCDYLSEVTHFSQKALSESAKKIGKKYIDLTFNSSTEKEERLLLIKFKYSDMGKYGGASKIKPEM